MHRNRTVQQHVKASAWLAISLWTMIIAATLGWNIYQGFQYAHEEALTTARANFFKDQAVRFWASQKGGVYVFPSARTQPSPYLAHLPDRDLTTTDGRKLTLMNPNFMMRELTEDFDEFYGIKGRIVGIVTLNPKNRADAWEEKAIHAFEKGTKEVIETSEINGKPYLRMIRPMMMTPDCMKCHGHLGFKIGDIRGAVGISVPLEGINRAATKRAFHLGATHIGIWLLGLTGIFLVARRTRQNMLEREKAIDELKLSACAFDEGLQAVMITDAKGLILRINPAFTQITGFSAEEALGQKPGILKSGQHDRDFYLDFWHKLRNDHRWEGEFWNRRKNGELFAAQENISVVLDDNHAVRYYVATFNDITERKKDQEKLQRAYGENRAITEAIHDCLYMLDLQGNLIWWNKRFEEITGLNDYELRGRSGTSFFVAEDQTLIAKRILEVFERGYAEAEARFITHEGPVYYHFNGVSIHDDQNNLIGIAGSGHDTSESKRTQEAIRKLNADLEHRVLERTAELEEAKKQAEHANHAKSEFLSSMSHELRTPMNAILGFSQLLQMSEHLDEDERANLEEILKGGKHLLELINEVLDLAKIEAGRVDLSFEPVNAYDLSCECLSLVEPLTQRHGISLITDCQIDDDSHVLADRTRLKQIIINLLSNGIKYNRPNGSVTIRVKLADKNMIRWEIVDTGYGIPPERHKEVFKAFHRLGADRMGVEGTGIGLVISKGIAESMHGQIGFESTPEVGSTFWLEMPRAVSPVTHSDDPATGPDSKAESTSENASYSVLYVEDNPPNIRLMESLIKRIKGVTLLTAINAETGLEIAQTQRPDLIIMDINLPGMSGYEALEHLQRNEATRHIPVLALSANAMAHDLERGKAAGFYDYLTKPINVDALIQIIHTILSKAHGKH